ncbi:MAG: hypothetical protein ABL867_08580 [Rickettsiales bacterium]
MAEDNTQQNHNAGGESPKDAGFGENLKGKAAAAMDGAKKTAEGLGEIFTKAKEGELHADVGGSSRKIKFDRSALKDTADEARKKIFQDGIDEMIKPKLEEFDKMSRGQKIFAQAGGNWGQAGKLEKGLRVGGSVVGLGAIISGTKNIVAPQKDENGERKDSVWKQIGKIGLGAAAIYASLTAGGKNRAMGI